MSQAFAELLVAWSVVGISWVLPHFSTSLHFFQACALARCATFSDCTTFAGPGSFVLGPAPSCACHHLLLRRRNRRVAIGGGVSEGKPERGASLALLLLHFLGESRHEDGVVRGGRSRDGRAAPAERSPPLIASLAGRRRAGNNCFRRPRVGMRRAAKHQQRSSWQRGRERQRERRERRQRRGYARRPPRRGRGA